MYDVSKHCFDNALPPGWPVLANALPLEKFEKARHMGGGDTLNWRSHNQLFYLSIVQV